MLWVLNRIASPELPRRGDPNEYPHIYMEKKAKLSLNYHHIPSLSDPL